MAYEVIARKWRPQTFADVVGQQHMTRTLCNAITQNRVAHTYLFVGPRGIGKTTTARIFAKALNCTNQTNGEPCCQCESCISIADGSNIDVIEIDAASNNGVDNIRNLRDEVLYMPTKSRFKVYIIDEVHMLSNQAWNALLKTIEEPPAHAKFLFATTEVHKVLPTVLSRCQRFDLRRIPARLITERLRMIVDKENVKISQSALEAIARAADGGMRDAQSLLDQMISFFGYGEEEISEHQILSLFGLTAEQDMKVMIRAILCNDKVTVIQKIHDLALQGKNLEKLFDDILAWLRAVQLCMIVEDPASILETGDESIAVYRQVGEGIDADVIQRLLEVMSPVGRILYDALNKQVFLETIILKAMRISHAAQISDLLRRLNQIRKGGELEILDDPRLQQPLKSTPPSSAIGGEKPEIKPQQEQRAPAPPQTTPPQAPKPVERAQPSQVTPTPPKQTVKPQQPTPQPQTEPLTDEPDSVPEELMPQPEPPERQRPQTATASPAPQPMKPAPAPVPPQPKPASVAAPKAPIPPEPEPYLEPSQSSLVMDEPVPEPKHDLKPEPKPEPKPEMAAQAATGTPANTPANTPAPTAPEPQVQDEKSKAPADEDPSSLVKTISEFDVKYSPQSLWHLLINEMDKLHQPVLKDYMMEGIPHTLKNSVLTICYDEEYDHDHCTQVKNNLEMLNNCLHRITGNRKAKIEIEMRKGVSSPRESKINLNSEELKEVRKRVEGNQFVQEALDLFNGSIVDVHG